MLYLLVNVELIYIVLKLYFMIKFKQSDEIFPNNKTISHHWSLIAKPSITVSLSKDIDTAERE